jgi:hypothetical protein
MRIRLIPLFHILLAICLGAALAQGAPETGTKTLFITGLPARANDPVRIKVMRGATELQSDGATALQSDGRPISNVDVWETAFNASDDWMTELSFAIKNVSPKKITCIIISSSNLVEAPFWQNGSSPKPVPGWTQNRMGQRPEHALHADGRTFPPDTDAPFELAQGEEFTMPIEDPEDYPALKARIENNLPISNVTAMAGGIVTVFFEDGTKWVNISHSYSRPAEQPGEWTKISFEEWADQPKTSEQ